jgi:hypothetical protein
MPADKAPGPDGFTGLFYQSAWPVIKGDIMQAFHSLWMLDSRGFYLINQAYMVLLRKKRKATEVRDFRPISLIHSLSKLIAKVLSTRLAPAMHAWSRQTKVPSSRAAPYRTTFTLFNHR